MKHEILAVVKFNDGEALVLKDYPQLKYTKYGEDTIIGTDGTFYEFYGYEMPKEGFSSKWKAFAGRKFDIELENGETEHCWGQWWSAITKRAIKELSINDQDRRVVRATANSLNNLKECYVYFGFNTIGSELEELRSTYTGPVYEYYEYDKMMKEGLV